MNDDLISRQAVLDLFQDNVSTLHNYARVWEAVEDMPSVTPTLTMSRHLGESSIKRITKELLTTDKVLGAEMPTERTGHWIRQDNTKKPLFAWYLCSECGSYIGDNTAKYCSNCGAKMIEGSDIE